jgi:hypothetical protein
MSGVLMTELTQEVVRELLDYDPVTGRAFWKKRDAKWFTEGKYTRQASADRWNTNFAGKEITNTNVYGYIIATIFAKKYPLTRLIFLYMTGRFPSGFADHKNRDKLDNRWENLRDLTPAQSAKNRGAFSTNTSGHTGVRQQKGYPNWNAHIKTGDTYINIGTFKTFEEAVAARIAKQIELGFEADHGI